MNIRMNTTREICDLNTKVVNQYREGKKHTRITTKRRKSKVDIEKRKKNDKQ